MRIIGQIEHPSLKITIFKLNNSFSVKFESGLHEQVYKFREGNEINGAASIKEIVDSHFIQQVEQQLIEMNQIRSKALVRFLPPVEDNFDSII